MRCMAARTRLHSKLGARTSPNPRAIIAALAEVNSRPETRDPKPETRKSKPEILRSPPG
ncbi:hypothetical protein T484DRAFT_1927982 [Baffinella frigidus]|nr:hypothetical protein T484DRAFT_1927982 [Cryptophyta sp. CCMP2293]